MSSILNWLFGSSPKVEEKPVEAKSSEVAKNRQGKTKIDPVQKEDKVNQQEPKVDKDPAFNTNLSSIKDIIEETLNEDKSESKIVADKSKKKKKLPNKEVTGSDEEYAKEFLFVKKTNSNSNQNDNKNRPSKVKKLDVHVDNEKSVEDDVGSSFLPVKERSRKGKNKSLLEKRNSEEALTSVLAQGITKKDTHKTSIIDHYKNKRNHSDLPSTASTSNDVPINKGTLKPPIENKQSKKVTSGLSYATIVANSAPSKIETDKSTCNLDENPELQVYSNLPTDLDSQETSKCGSNDIIHSSASNLEKEDLSSVEVLSQYSEDSDNSIEDTKGDFENATLLDLEHNSGQKNQEGITFEGEHKKESTFESSVEVVKLPEDIDRVSDYKKSHVEENILLSVIKSPDPLRDSFSNNFIEDHFSENQNSETVDEILSTNEVTDQSIQDIVDKIVDDCEPLAPEKDKHSDYYQFFKQQSADNIHSNLNGYEEYQINSEIDDKFIDSETTLSSVNGEIKQENYSFHKVVDNFVAAEVQDSLPVYSKEVDSIKQQVTETAVHNKEDQSIEKPFERKEAYIVESYKSSSVDISDISCQEEPIDLDMAQVRVLTLNDKEHQDSTIYRIEKKFVLQFRLGPSLLGRKIKLYCNYPQEHNGILDEFDRGSYQLLTWCQDKGCKNADDTASFAQIVAKLAGSFHYYFVYENENTEERQGSGYFIIDPVLKYGTNEELPLDCIQCQTVLAKHLGSLSTWESKLRVAKESGYNMIHFSPIQELGDSNSSYSLKEQLKLNPKFNEENGSKPTFEDIEKFTSKIRKEWKVLSVCDIVLNHTANESDWIKEHPEATYNCLNCPYMRPAYLLDVALHYFSMDVKKGYYDDRGIPPEVSTEDHLDAIRYHFKINVLEPLKIQELFVVDVTKILEEFLSSARKTAPSSDNERDSIPDIKIIQDAEYRRLKSTIDMNLALKKYNCYRLDCFDEESRVRRCAEDLKIKLDSLNELIIKEVAEDLDAAVENVIAGIRYFRVQEDGPKFKEITISTPLVYRYFTDFGSPKTMTEFENIMYSEQGKFLMAHNGWVINSDPLKNFADAGTKTYIRRELIAWGDSVKLRFGNKPEDSPFLWDYMRRYVEQTVKIFDGVRLDNCHSTPIPVAEYLLDCARKIRPDLYVVAELFTNSDLTDNIFVNRLGITSLIREAMSAWDSHEEGRLVYRYGGVPVGSFYQPSVRPLVPMVAHALFLDLTHDNPSPIEKRSVFDLLPSTALVNMACCASGSNRGYDELVPHHIHVVDETRQYTEWTDDESLAAGNARYVNETSGIIAAKKALNDLHFKLGKEGYNQVYVDQIDPDIVAVTRHNPETHISYVLVAFTAFGHPDLHAGDYQRNIKALRVEGILDEIVLEASLSHTEAKSGGSAFGKFDNFAKDSEWINGLSEYQVSIKQHIQVSQSGTFEEVNSGTPNVTQLNFKNFKPGSIVVTKFSLPDDMKEAVSKIRNLIISLSAKKGTDLVYIMSKMTLADMNRALYRCDQEERDEGNGFDVYNIPNFGSFVYCGLQGFMSLLSNIRPNNDLGHPLCANLRDGNWMIEYVWKRLKIDEGTKELGQWIEENTKSLHNIPRYLVPSYFDAIFTGLYVNMLEHSYNLMSDFVKRGSTFVRSLSLGSVQFTGYVRSANLPDLSPNLAPPKPPTRRNKNGETIQACVTLSAGLPHFSVGYMRNWGRDTFIALRGLLILTGRFEEARQHILGYAACLRHGLIPNLLDGGRNSRFNCRDAVWWWLYCIKSYCEEAPNGLAVLSDLVSRIFPTDDSPAQPPGTVDQPLQDVIQEALNTHFQGLKFRERNAGRQIDEQMTDAGFNNQIGVHPETGFVFGGNQWNCGTWMDKMGSSDKAGNKGKPATPRDGSAIELVGLSKAVVSWLAKLNKEGKYSYDGVERVHKNGAVTKWTFKEWADKIQSNFEKNFWIGPKPSSDESRPDLINKKNIYKDTFGSSQPWTDYQLRCNVPIAMVAAPELFDPQHAWAALQQTEKYLLGPLGMKTLDPEDWNYRGDYDNSNDSDDFHTSHGFNYHQGPTSPWRGLPELTNSNGAYCNDSSRTQAWSMSCVLEVLYDLQQIESKKISVN